MHFLHPLGLISLASLGGVLFLYFYVFRGRRVEVSALFLWATGRSLTREGQTRRRPPVSLPLFLELLAALLLSLTVAGLVYRRVTTHAHMVVILDSSASMNAGQGGESLRLAAREKILELCREMGRNSRVTIVESGFGGRILKGKPLSAAEAAACLDAWQPSAPDHSFGLAIEIARSLAGGDGAIILLTDKPADAGDVVGLGIGRPMENTAWVAAHWAGRSEVFALVRHFGGGEPTKTVAVYGDGAEVARRKVDFKEGDAMPLVFQVPDDVASVRMELPRDALANDNVLRLTRPVRLAVATRIDVGDAVLAGHVAKALAASDKVELIEEGAAALVFTRSDAEPDESGDELLEVAFHVLDQETARPYVGPYFIDGFHRLTRGLDLKGAVWAGDADVRTERKDVLISVGEVPLVVLDGRRLGVNLTPARTNIFQMPAWPVLMSNIVDYVHARTPGLKRASYRLGESLSFYQPARWEGEIVIEDPDAVRLTFDGDHVYYGRLKREGSYRIMAGGEQVATIDVNLLSESESDLTGLTSFGDVGSVRSSLFSETDAKPFHQELSLASVALLLFCWSLLERRKV